MTTPSLPADDFVGTLTPVEGEKPRGELPRDQLTAGVVARFDETDTIDTRDGRRPFHVFTTHAGGEAGVRFGVWGTAGLNGKLRNLRRGSVVFLRYEGKTDHPDDADQPTKREWHSWTVARVNRDQVRTALARFQAANDAAARAARQNIAERAEQARQRAARRDADAPPHGDADFPYGPGR